MGCDANSGECRDKESIPDIFTEGRVINDYGSLLYCLKSNVIRHNSLFGYESKTFD